MPISLTVKRFRGRPLDRKKLEQALQDAVLRYATEIADLYLMTMETFDEGRPEAYPVLLPGGGRVIRRLNVYVRGDYMADDNKIYMWLDFGARRLVGMAPGFQAKTSAGGFRPRAGAGGPKTTKGGKLSYFKKGQEKYIEPRNFTRRIAAMAREQGVTFMGTYPAFMADALREFLRRNGA